MPLKDIRTEFTAAPQSSVRSVVDFSDEIARGMLKGSTKTWIKKEMSHPDEARIELMAEEFFCLIIPHQPQTRLLHNPETGAYIEKINHLKDIFDLEVKEFARSDILDNSPELSNGLISCLQAINRLNRRLIIEKDKLKYY